MDESRNRSFEKNLAQLERDGFLLIKGALDMETVQKWRDSLYRRYERGEYDRRNSVGNVSYNQLLEQEPEMTRALIAHPSVAPYLKATLGKQCQLRSVRAHLNPDDYTQEWHMDFYDYWYQQEKVDASRFVQGFCMNTTFYLTDNTPERAALPSSETSVIGRFPKNFGNISGTGMIETIRSSVGATNSHM